MVATPDEGPRTMADFVEVTVGDRTEPFDHTRPRFRPT